MPLLILAFLLSMLPNVLIFLWLRKAKDDEKYQNICLKGLLRGILFSSLMVLLISTIFYVFERLFITKYGVIISEVFHNFIVLAFAEEIVKYLTLRGLIKKNSYSYSQLDILSLMMIVGIGFGMIESLIYAFITNAAMMIVRGITAMHCGYGFIMGYFISNAMKTKKKGYTFLGIFIPCLLHGTYDLCLSEELAKISEYYGFISLALAIFAIITLFIAIKYIRKSRKNSECIKPLLEAQSNQG